MQVIMSGKYMLEKKREREREEGREREGGREGGRERERDMFTFSRNLLCTKEEMQISQSYRSTKVKVSVLTGRCWQEAKSISLCKLIGISGLFIFATCTLLSGI